MHARVLFEEVNAEPAVAATPLTPAGISIIHCKAAGAVRGCGVKERTKFVNPPLDGPDERMSDACADRHPQPTSNSKPSSVKICFVKQPNFIMSNSSAVIANVLGLIDESFRTLLRLFPEGR